MFEIFAQEGREPIALYRLLANAPKMLRAYSGLARGLRYEASTPRALRELVILRTAKLTASDYEWAHHRKMAAEAGVRAEQVSAIERWEESDAFDERERAALRCTDGVHVLALTDEAFEELDRVLGTAEAIEIVLLAAFYQAVARIIQGLGLEVEPEYQPYLGQ